MSPRIDSIGEESAQETVSHRDRRRSHDCSARRSGRGSPTDRSRQTPRSKWIRRTHKFHRERSRTRPGSHPKWYRDVWAWRAQRFRPGKAAADRQHSQSAWKTLTLAGTMRRGSPRRRPTAQKFTEHDDWIATVLELARRCATKLQRGVTDLYPTPIAAGTVVWTAPSGQVNTTNRAVPCSFPPWPYLPGNRHSRELRSA